MTPPLTPPTPADNEHVAVLEPCPFCGSTAVDLVQRADWYVWCRQCGVLMDERGARTSQQASPNAAAEAWNRRALRQGGEAWIPVSERLPEAGERVLTWHDFGTEVSNPKHHAYRKRGWIVDRPNWNRASHPLATPTPAASRRRGSNDRSAAMKVAVIVSDFGAAANIGAEVERKVRIFDLPPEVAKYIAASRGQYTTVVLAVVEDTTP